jgi:hypothetical protein
VIFIFLRHQKFQHDLEQPALGEKLTPNDDGSMSAFPSTADFPLRNGHVSFVPRDNEPARPSRRDARISWSYAFVGVRHG